MPQGIETEKVGVISLGGTFDKSYDPVPEKMVFSGTSCIPGILRTCGVETVAFEALMQVDSNDLTDALIRSILETVRRGGLRRLVIVHGTSAMVETAVLFATSDLTGTYVFTGAMVPFSHSHIEASFNLGGAIALASTLPAGTYIHMHGQVFDPLKVRKDVAIARFVTVDE